MAAQWRLVAQIHVILVGDGTNKEENGVEGGAKAGGVLHNATMMNVIWYRYNLSPCHNFFDLFS